MAFIPRRGGQEAKRQCLVLQRQIIGMAESRTKPVSASELATLSAAWCKLEEARRILLGKPLPGTLKPELAGNRPLGKLARAFVAAVERKATMSAPINVSTVTSAVAQIAQNAGVGDEPSPE